MIIVPVKRRPSVAEVLHGRMDQLIDEGRERTKDV